MSDRPVDVQAERLRERVEAAPFSDKWRREILALLDLLAGQAEQIARLTRERDEAKETAQEFAVSATELMKSRVAVERQLATLTEALQIAESLLRGEGYHVDPDYAQEWRTIAAALDAVDRDETRECAMCGETEKCETCAPGDAVDRTAPERPTCHCGMKVAPRDPDPWEGRMDAYCEACATNRCDCYPDQCPVKHPAVDVQAERLRRELPRATREALAAALDLLAGQAEQIDLLLDDRGKSPLRERVVESAREALRAAAVGEEEADKSSRGSSLREREAGADTPASETWVRKAYCMQAWPECESGAYDPRCCRFPKSCSCLVRVGEDTPE